MAPLEQHLSKRGKKHATPIKHSTTPRRVPHKRARTEALAPLCSLRLSLEMRGPEHVWWHRVVALGVLHDYDAVPGPQPSRQPQEDGALLPRDRLADVRIYVRTSAACRLGLQALWQPRRLCPLRCRERN